MPDADLIHINHTLTPATKVSERIYNVDLIWKDIDQNSLTGEPYFFFVKEVDSLGNDYTPEYFEKLELGVYVYNRYVAKTLYQPPTITKLLEGRAIKPGEFEFEMVRVYENGDELFLGSAKNDAEGKVVFPQVPISAVSLGISEGGFIREKIPADADKEEGMTYDSSTYEVSIEVTDNGNNDGVIYLTPIYSGNNGTFRNTYTASGEFVPQVTKALSGRALKENEFSFVLRKQDETEALQTVTNTADGKVTFAAIQYTQADIGKTYQYVINELAPAPGEMGMKYDNMSVLLTVEVEDAGNGKLTITPTYSADTEFNNAFTPMPSVALTKKADKTRFTAIDETISYTLELKNTGNVALNEVAVTDNFADLSAATPAGDTNGDKILDVGETWTYSYTYKTAQNDMDRGEVKNTVSVTSSKITAPVIDEIVVPGVQNAATEIGIVASPVSVSKAGDTVTYTYTVKNTGNVTLTHAKLYDSRLGFITENGGVNIAVGATKEYTKTYTLTQPDIDSGADIVNTVTLTAEQYPTVTSLPERELTATVKITQEPKASIEIVANPGNMQKPGTVTYSYTVKNTGNVTLTGAALTDSRLGAIELGNTTIPVNGSVTGTATYDVTQAHIDAGTAIENTATVKADQNPAADQAKASVTISQSPKAEITKTADKEVFSAPGTVIYTYTVKNTGNVTLEGVSVYDDVIKKDVPLNINKIPVSGSATGKLEYAVTQAHIDAGEAITNTATVTSTTPNLPETKTTETISFTQTPAMTVTKTADKEQFTAVGEAITYTIEVKNDGNITLEGVTVTDSLKDLTETGRKRFVKCLFIFMDAFSTMAF